VVKASGILSLIYFIFSFCFFEKVLDSPKLSLTQEIKQIHYFAKPERGRYRLNVNGYRGRRATANKEAVRIFTIGGSSTYGTPLKYSEFTINDILDNILKNRRPEKFEVLNAGIPGYGIMQIYDSIKHIILKDKPDIIVINSWFNDSAPAPGWWGVIGKSDYEAYPNLSVLWKLQELPIIKNIIKLKTYGLIKYYLIDTKQNIFKLISKNKPKEEVLVKPKEKIKVKNKISKEDLKKLTKKERKALRKKNKQENNANKTTVVKEKTKYRISPKEFGQVMELIIKLGEKHDFLPVFMLEPINNSVSYDKGVKSNKWYKETVRISKKYKLPIINPLDLHHKYENDFLFFDFIHPNHKGHILDAESIYQGLFVNGTEKSNKFLKKLNINLENSEYKRELRFIKNSKEIDSFNTSISSLKDNIDLEIFINGESVSYSSYSKEELKNINLQNLNYKKLPLNEIILRSYPGKNYSSELFDFKLPFSFHIISGGKKSSWKSEVLINNNFYQGKRGYLLITSDKKGNVIDYKYFDTFKSKNNFKLLIKELNRIKEYKEETYLFLSVNTDGYTNINKDLLKNSLKSFGEIKKLPSQFQSFVFIGNNKKTKDSFSLSSNKEINIKTNLKSGLNYLIK